jgi:hypothetical protein
MSFLQEMLANFGNQNQQGNGGYSSGLPSFVQQNALNAGQDLGTNNFDFSGGGNSPVGNSLSDLGGNNDSGGFGMEDFTSIAGFGKDLIGSIMAIKNFGLAKDQFKFKRDATIAGHNAQVGLTNERLSTRAGSRNARGVGDGLTGAQTVAKFGATKLGT